jgi:hypothetical protein
MSEHVRATYLHAIDVAVALVDDPALDARFDEPSALAHYTCGALAGHLLRSLLTVDTYLDDPVVVTGAPPSLDAVTYFARALDGHDPLTSDVHASVRERSAELAGPDVHALRARAHELGAKLHERLPAAAPDVCVRVFGGMEMALDAYLDTRLVELAVHVDDLAASLGIATPDLGDAATARAVEVTAELARRRHGATAVLRTLTRTERAPGSISAF